MQVVEYRPEAVSDAVLLGVLDRAHNMFCLFQVYFTVVYCLSTLSHVMSLVFCTACRAGWPCWRLRAAMWRGRGCSTSTPATSQGTRTAPCLGLSTAPYCSLRLESAGLLDMWGGLQYLPLEAEPFLRVQTLVTRLQLAFPLVSTQPGLQH